MELKRMLRNKRKLAFTLAEVVIVMAILGIMMVAFAPVITKRTTSSAAAFKNFRPMGTHNGIYFGSAGDDKTVIIGGNNIEQSYSLNPKLMLINSLKNAGGAPSFPTGVTVGLGSITVSTNPPNLLDLWNVRLHPQIAFATEAGDEIVPQGQLLVTPTGNYGSVVLGGRTDEPYRMQRLKDATIVGAHACIDNADLMDGSTSISGVVCLGANAGRTDKIAPQPWTSSSEEIKARVAASAAAYANDNWNTFAVGRWCWGQYQAGLRYSYNSREEAVQYVHQHENDYQVDASSWSSFWDSFIPPESWYQAQSTISCWLPRYDDKYAREMSSEIANQQNTAVLEYLAGDKGLQTIYIGDKNLEYSLDNIYFGANNLDRLIKNKLQDPHYLAPILRPYLWATMALTLKCAKAAGGFENAIGVTSGNIENFILKYDEGTVSTGSENLNTVTWKYYINGQLSESDAVSSVPFGGIVKSDKRLKNVGELFKGGLEQISKLQIFNYTYKNDGNKTPHIGVMAQDLQEVFPDAVSENKDGFLYVRTEDMFYAGLNAIKELYDKVLDHETRIQQLEKRVDELEQMLKKYENLEKRLNNIDKKVSRRADKKQAKLKAEVEELTQSLKAD